MIKGAILSLAFFFLFFSGCSTKMTAPSPSPSPSPSPEPPTKASHSPDEYFYDLPVFEEKLVTPEETETIEKVEEEKHEAEEEQPEKVVETETAEVSPPPAVLEIPAPPKEPLSLPDLTVSDLFLKQKRRLVVTLTNAGSAPFPMMHGELIFFVDGRFERSYPLDSLSDQALLQPQQSIALTTPLILYGRHEVEARVDTPVDLREFDKENNRLRRILEGLPIGPDIVIRDFDLTEDLELSIILTNSGEADLRKGVILRVKIYMNDRKISDFDHFVPEELKAHSGNFYILSPPYRVSIRGVSRVRVSLAPRLRSDDIRSENNTFERRFIVFPFQIGPRGREQFSFFIPPLPGRSEGGPEKIKLEARWEGSETLLTLSFRGSDDTRNLPDISGKSPIRVEWSIPGGDMHRESLWKVSVTNPAENRVEGHLIIQHP